MTNDHDDAARVVMLAWTELIDGLDRDDGGKRARARKYFAAWSALLRTNPETIPPGPRELLAAHCEYLASGIIPGPIADCAGPGNPVGPSEERDIRAAVIYIEAVRRGVIADRQPVKTVGTAYGAIRDSVQGWVKARRESIEDAELVDAVAITERMRAAGARYTTSGRTHAANRHKAKG